MYYVKLFSVLCTVFFFSAPSARNLNSFRTVIEGGGRVLVRNYCCRTKKEQIQYAKVSSATASAHWDQRKLYSEIESQTKKCKSPEKP